MDTTPILENDSDVEVIEPEVLQDHFRTQQLRLITALSRCQCQIPKKWTEFEIFVRKTLKFQLSNDLIRTVWAELCTAEHKTGTGCNIVELSDEEDDTKQPDKSCKAVKLTKTEKIIYGEVNHAWALSQSSSERLLGIGIVEISDEEAESNHYSEETLAHLAENAIHTNGCTKGEKVPIPSLERSFCLPNARKRTRKARRCSLPAKINEQEAEELREQLLLDKIIELELPQVIKGFMKNNNLKNCAKKRKKNFKNKVVDSVIIPDGLLKVLPSSLKTPVPEIANLHD